MDRESEDCMNQVGAKHLGCDLWPPTQNTPEDLRSLGGSGGGNNFTSDPEVCKLEVPKISIEAPPAVGPGEIKIAQSIVIVITQSNAAPRETGLLHQLFLWTAWFPEMDEVDSRPFGIELLIEGLFLEISHQRPEQWLRFDRPFRQTARGLLGILLGLPLRTLPFIATADQK